MNIFKTITADLDFRQNPDFHHIVNDRLHRLIKVNCDIELDSFPCDDQLYFKYVNDNFSISRLVYNCNYNGKKGIAYLNIDYKDEMTVLFCFDISDVPKTILMGSNIIKIFVNHELEFVSSLFEKRFDFGWKSSVHSQSVNRLSRSSVFVFKKVDLSRNVETLILSLSGGVSKDVDLGKDNSLYLSEDGDFYKTFFNLMSYCEDHHHEFQSVFNDYPTHLELALNQNNCLSSFLFKFESDYRNNHHALKNKILLLDMQLI